MGGPTLTDLGRRWGSQASAYRSVGKTVEDLLQASNFVERLEARQALKIRLSRGVSEDGLA